MLSDVRITCFNGDLHIEACKVLNLHVSFSNLEPRLCGILHDVIQKVIYGFFILGLAYLCDASQHSLSRD